jgi:hypothetical protein
MQGNFLFHFKRLFNHGQPVLDLCNSFWAEAIWQMQPVERMTCWFNTEIYGTIREHVGISNTFLKFSKVFS